jgi:[ribosomal protein S5]-alanine N-acetyltransferase
MLTISIHHIPELHTQRCRLRPFLDTDLPVLFALRSDPEVMRYVDREPFRSMDEAEEMMGKIRTSAAAGEGFSWVIADAEDRMIGMCGIWRIDKEHHRGEVGYTLLPAYWGQGYITEVMQAVIGFGFRDLGLHSLEANVNPNNAASIRVAEKLGFVKEAHFRENYYFRGQYIDSAIYSLLSHEWQG